MEPNDREYLEHQLEVYILSGFEDAESALVALEDEMYGVDDATRNLLRLCARKLEQEQRKREATWSGRTQNFRLDQAFRALRRAGIIALHRAGVTQSDGWSDVHEARRGGERGAVFYHGQDVERALDGGGLMLTFGAFEGGDAADVAIAQEVCEALREQAFTVEWSGEAKKRIAVRPFEWRRRHFTSPVVPRTKGAIINIFACESVYRVSVMKVLKKRLGIDLKTSRAELANLTNSTDSIGRYNGRGWSFRSELSFKEAETVAQELCAAGAHAKAYAR